MHDYTKIKKVLHNYAKYTIIMYKNTERKAEDAI